MNFFPEIFIIANHQGKRCQSCIFQKKKKWCEICDEWNVRWSINSCGSFMKKKHTKRTHRINETIHVKMVLNRIAPIVSHEQWRLSCMYSYCQESHLLCMSIYEWCTWKEAGTISKWAGLVANTAFTTPIASFPQHWRNSLFTIHFRHKIHFN